MVRVMRCNDDRIALFFQTLDEPQGLELVAVVQVRRGLIKQNGLGLRNDGTGNGRLLAFTAGDFCVWLVF